MMETIYAVIVTFNPEFAKFNELFHRLSGQVAKIIVIDNGSEQSAITYLTDITKISGIPSVLRCLGENLGIAKAQNVGIDLALNEGASYVALFDHDSKPHPEMISTLLLAIQDLELKGLKVAAAGPRYTDSRQDNPPPFIMVDGLKVVRQRCTNDSPIVPVSYVIASGSLIPASTLKTVGLMKEELFIDYVDIEWGLRALEKGYQSFGVCNALMDHDLGDDPIIFNGKSIPLHSPLRHYYLFRNAIYLYKQPYLPISWKIGDFYRLILKYGFYTLFAKPRWQHFSMMTKGIWDGLHGKMGKYSGA